MYSSLSKPNILLFLIVTAGGASAEGVGDVKPDRAALDHWAFQAPVRLQIPSIPDSPFAIRNPIDAFIAAEHAKRGLVPQTSAEKRLLLRRVYLDLIGLPPTREELAAFVADQSPDAYEKVVDRLLASVQYGERWGRHWMDIWRYSDWWGLGAEVRNSQKHIRHWRDWIIESLNADKGYDQMIREMIAADELYPNDLGRLRASGFLARHYFKFNRTTWLDEAIEHTSKAFLGITMNCTKCHEHKYDPIDHADYYRFRAFFEPYQLRTDQLPGEADLEKEGLPRAFDCNLDAATYLHERGDDRRAVVTEPLEPGVPAFLSLGELTIEPVSLPPEAYLPGLRPFVLEDQLRAAHRRIGDAQAAVGSANKKLAELEMAVKPADDKPPDPIGSDGKPGEAAWTVDQARLAATLAAKSLATAEATSPSLVARAAADRARHLERGATNVAELAREAARLERALELAKAEEELARAELESARAQADKKPDLEKKVVAARESVSTATKSLESPGENYSPLRGSLKTLESNIENEESRSKPFPTTSSGRRSALAGWMTDRRHPLTARVAVNHMWARHFGRPLVTTVFDFGRKGAVPTHPELLDWLAVEFMDHGWSMKHIHRLIVTSNTYRLGPSGRQDADPENRFYWHRSPVRMESQVIRDSLLYLAGELDFTVGGPSVPTSDETSRRRSLYLVHSHNEHHKLLSMFDDASVLECYRRSESIVPQQALALENSKFAMDCAGTIARRLAETLGGPSEAVFIREAFELLLATPPTAAEQVESERALNELAESNRDLGLPIDALHLRTMIVHALINHNDFVTIR